MLTTPDKLLFLYVLRKDTQNESDFTIKDSFPSHLLQAELKVTLSGVLEQFGVLSHYETDVSAHELVSAMPPWECYLFFNPSLKATDFHFLEGPSKQAPVLCAITPPGSAQSWYIWDLTHSDLKISVQQSTYVYV